VHSTASKTAAPAQLKGRRKLLSWAKRKVQLHKLVNLENFSRLSELTSTVKKHVHVETDLVICDNTAKWGRQLGCNWIRLCVAKDASRSGRVQI